MFVSNYQAFRSLLKQLQQTISNTFGKQRFPKRTQAHHRTETSAAHRHPREDSQSHSALGDHVQERLGLQAYRKFVQ